MRKQSAEIIDSVVYNANPEELLYLLRKTSDALEDALYPYASEADLAEIRALAEQENRDLKRAQSYISKDEDSWRTKLVGLYPALKGALGGGLAGAGTGGLIGTATDMYTGFGKKGLFGNNRDNELGAYGAGLGGLLGAIGGGLAGYERATADSRASRALASIAASAKRR